MKQLTAKHLLDFLTNLKSQGYDLSNIKLNYRTDTDSDVEQINFVGEDLFDSETNNILESLVFMKDASDYF